MDTVYLVLTHFSDPLMMWTKSIVTPCKSKQNSTPEVGGESEPAGGCRRRGGAYKILHCVTAEKSAAVLQISRAAVAVAEQNTGQSTVKLSRQTY